MKQTIPFFAIVLSLLVASALLLTGCMYAIAVNNGDAKPYHIEEIDMSGGSIGDSPMTQAALQEKFGAYIHEEDGGKTAIVFSDEQYRTLKLRRLNRERSALTYEEILFLINDSVNLYFGHDKVVLTKAVADGISAKSHLSSTAEVIEPYHGDFTEFDDNGQACEAYNRMIQDIYSIIYYRIYVHDAGFRKVSEIEYAIPSTCLVERKICAEGSWYEGAEGTEVINVMQMLSIDGGDTAGDAYKEKLANEYQSYTGKLAHMRSDANSTQFLENTLESPLLLTYRRIERGSGEPSFFLVDTDAFTTAQLFPTEELKALYPGISRMYTVTAAFGLGFFRPMFVLNEADHSFRMSESMLSSYALFGTYEESDGKLTLIAKDAEEPGTVYQYVFYEKNGIYAYAAEESIPSQRVMLLSYLEFYRNPDPFSYGE